MKTQETVDADDSSLALDLLNADYPNEVEGTRESGGLWRPPSENYDHDEMSRQQTPPTRQPLLRAIHHELSQLAAEADGVSERVKRIINKQRQRLDSVIEGTTKAPRRLQSKIAVPLDKRRRQFQGNIRKAVTGDPTKSVRLHIEEKRSKPVTMRMMDKAAFTVGVLNMVVSEYVLLLRPDWFWLWYSLMMPGLMLMRYFDYRQKKWLFYFDFCYFVQACCLVSIFVVPNDCRLQKTIFMYSMGTLLWAVPLWRNSLVFHDVDKMTSCFIHLVPGWLSLTLRWCALDAWRGGGTTGVEPLCHTDIHLGDMRVALSLYLLWQAMYYFKTEYYDKSKLDADPEIQTSLRWLATSPKNPMHRLVLWIMRSLRLFKKDETFDPHSLKTKMIFMASQLVYTVVVSLPTPFLYNKKWTSISLAFGGFLFALWNSSNYYIDVFSRKYWPTIEAEAAAKAEALLVKAAKAQERKSASELGRQEGVHRSMSTPERVLSELCTPGSVEDATWTGIAEPNSRDTNGPRSSDDDEADLGSGREADSGSGWEAVAVLGNGSGQPAPEKCKDV